MSDDYFFKYVFFELCWIKKCPKKEVTLDYINWIIDKETISYIDNLFVDVETEFFELLKENNWTISLEKEENRNIIVNYLIENWVSTKYIEEFLPTNKFETIISDFKTKNSTERKFFMAFIKSILVTNILVIIWIWIYMFYFSKRTFNPIWELIKKVKNFKIWNKYEIINYNKKDEIWLLVSAINTLSDDLKKQEEIKHKFLADISHELKTPITAIRCYLEWITDWVIPFNNENIEKVISEIWRLVNLVNMIMDYEKFNTEVMNLNKKRKDISEIIDDVTSHYTLSLKEWQKIITPKNSFYTEVDEERFIQVIHNLVSNFIKYSWENKTLEIILEDWKIIFKDNWAWVKPEKLPYITEKFFQADDSKTWSADERWIWIWLSIVEKIVSSHSWTMEISSEYGKWFNITMFTETSQK